MNALLFATRYYMVRAAGMVVKPQEFFNLERPLLTERRVAGSMVYD